MWADGSKLWKESYGVGFRDLMNFGFIPLPGLVAMLK